MQTYARRVWIAVGAVASVVLGAWLLTSLFQGVLVVFAGALFGVFLVHLSGLVSRLTGWSYPWAFGLVLLLLVLTSVATLALLGTQISQQVAEFIEQFEQASGNARERLESQEWWRQLHGVRQNAEEALTSSEAVSTATTAATRAATSTLTAFGGVILVIFLGIYFAVDPQLYRLGILSLVPPKRRARVDEVLTMTSEMLWWWTLGRLLEMAVIGVGTAIGLWFLGVPLPIPLAVIAALLTFIPNLGPLLALVPAVLFSMQQGTETALYVVAFYLTLQFFESYFLTPIVEQHHVRLPPGVTLSAQLLFGMMAGILGLLFATPLAVVIMIQLREFYVKDLLQAEPATTNDD